MKTEMFAPICNMRGFTLHDTSTRARALTGVHTYIVCSCVDKVNYTWVRMGHWPNNNNETTLIGTKSIGSQLIWHQVMGAFIQFDFVFPVGVTTVENVCVITVRAAPAFLKTVHSIRVKKSSNLTGIWPQNYFAHWQHIFPSTEEVIIRCIPRIQKSAFPVVVVAGPKKSAVRKRCIV